MRLDRLTLAALVLTFACGDDGSGGDSTTDPSTSTAESSVTDVDTTAGTQTTTATTATTAGTSTAGDTTGSTGSPTGSESSESSSSGSGSTTSAQCISQDEAIDVAVQSHHPQIADPTEEHIIPPVVDNGAAGFTVHVCDLNIECPCRPGEGWLVDVDCGGTITDDTLLGHCPFG